MSKLDRNLDATAGVVWYPNVAVTLLADCSSFLPAGAGEEALYTTLGAPPADGSCMHPYKYGEAKHDEAKCDDAEHDEAKQG